MDGDDIRWRTPSCYFLIFLLCSFFIFVVDIFEFNSLKMAHTLFPADAPLRRKRHHEEGFLIKTESCRIPEMNPFDPLILEHILTEPQIICDKNNTPLVESNFTSLYVVNSSLQMYGVLNYSDLTCWYCVFFRVTPNEDEHDDKGEFKNCVYFNDSVNVEDEFVRVVCTYNETQIYKDFFAFVPIKHPSHHANAITTSEVPLNVLVIGIDAVSRLNLHRQMPKTVGILNELDAVELFGYNKVGDNTFPNLIPVLTGLTEDELVNVCWEPPDDRFDDCPFIWKNFSEQGYLTAFGEDSAWMGIFNYQRQGFEKQPTDYFWGPFNHVSEHEIGYRHEGNAYLCVGPRLVYKTLLNYIDRFTRTMHANNKNYFAFFWGASLSHDYMNKPKLGDNSYAKFLNNLRLNGVFKNTVLIFMSDHGIRWGGIRTTYQGRLEERLPFVYVVLPEFYKEEFFHAYANLEKNARRLTTPFDLHETLKDLRNPYSLTKEVLNARRPQNGKLKRGYSFFESIPSNRSCVSAGIESHWCTCQKTVEVNKTDKFVVEAAFYTVSHINKKLDGYAECAILILAEIKNARLHSFGEHVLVGKNYTQDYTLVLRTIPGDGVFEVTVRQFLSGNNYYFNVTGTISRINLYGNQSLCISEFHLKLYCFCKNLLFR